MEVRHYNDEIEKGEKSIYLAGPSLRVDWRENALKQLRKFDGIVYIPSELYGGNEQSLDKKYIWENNALKESTLITMWIPNNRKVLHNYVVTPQFGYWANVGKTLYGRPDDIYSEQFDAIYKPVNNQLGDVTFKDLETLLNFSVSWANLLFELKENSEPIDQRIKEALRVTCEQYRFNSKGSQNFDMDFYANLFRQLTELEQLYHQYINCTGETSDESLGRQYLLKR